MKGEIKTVVIEFSPSLQKVLVRGIFDGPQPNVKPLPLRSPDNIQNYVACFEGLDMGSHPGFGGLIAAPDKASKGGVE